MDKKPAAETVPIDSTIQHMLAIYMTMESNKENIKSMIRVLNICTSSQVPKVNSL